MSVSLLLLILVINNYVGDTFASLAKNNIASRSMEIERTVRELYNPFIGEFDLAAVEAVGMIFAHEGYITTVKDKNSEVLWDARACDMQECNKVINDITARMEKDYRLSGGMRRETYPVLFGGNTVGTIDIETYGPFFYSETEAFFLLSLNRLLVVASGVFLLMAILLSVLLASAISRPVRKASAAAHTISGGNFTVRIESNYRTAELHELATSLNVMAAELQEAERRQEQLVQDVAHELRTPITCLQGNIEAMIDGVWQATPERLASCHEEVVRLTQLVEDLQLLTNLEWEKITLDKSDFDLAQLLETTAEQFRPSALEKNITIQLDARPCPVFADYNRLKQVFINLLSNAVKYTDHGSIIIKAAPMPDKRVEVSVADTGIGIPADALPHVFERLYRSDKSRNRGTGGSGIGLAIAAAIVKAHGGSISAVPKDSVVLSESGKGSVFRVVV
jgi:signal transduction histidine kinase